MYHSILHRYPTLRRELEPWEVAFEKVQDKIEEKRREVSKNIIHFFEILREFIKILNLYFQFVVNQLKGTDALLIPEKSPV
jgi:hypothetical protein